MRSTGGSGICLDGAAGGSELRLRLVRREREPIELVIDMTDLIEALRRTPTFECCTGEASGRELKVEARRLVLDESKELVLREMKSSSSQSG